MSCCPQTSTQNSAAEVWPCQEITEGFAELQSTRRREEESEAQSNQVFLPGQLWSWGHAYVAYFPCFTFEWTQPCRDLFSAYWRKDFFASKYCKFGPEQIFMTVPPAEEQSQPQKLKVSNVQGCGEGVPQRANTMRFNANSQRNYRLLERNPNAWSPSSGDGFSMIMAPCVWQAKQNTCVIQNLGINIRIGNQFNWALPIEHFPTKMHLSLWVSYFGVLRSVERKKRAVGQWILNVKIPLTPTYYGTCPWKCSQATSRQKSQTRHRGPLRSSVEMLLLRPTVKQNCLKCRWANMRWITGHFSKLTSEANQEAYANPGIFCLVSEKLETQLVSLCYHWGILECSCLWFANLALGHPVGGGFSSFATQHCHWAVATCGSKNSRVGPHDHIIISYANVEYVNLGKHGRRPSGLSLPPGTPGTPGTPRIENTVIGSQGFHVHLEMTQ